MPEVVLQRVYVTPGHRYKPGPDGDPVNIPQRVIDKHGLPKDAEVVSAGYVSKSLRDEEDDYIPGDVAAAQHEEEVRQEASQRLASYQARERAERAVKEQAVSKKRPLLSRSLSTIKTKIGDMETDELASLRRKEVAGKNRRAVLEAIDALL